MLRGKLCNVTLSKRNTTKHNQSKKHENYSNLILNRYVIKNVEVNKFKDILISFFTAHTKKNSIFSQYVFT